VLYKYRDIQYRERENLTFTSTIKHVIQTQHEDPAYRKPYKYPQSVDQEVNKQIKEMIEQGIIRKSKSPYCSPIWVVPKKADASGKPKFRLVVDYRNLNEITINDKFPIPKMDEILDKLGRYQYFTTIDLAKGFHQIQMQRLCRPLNCFQNQITLEEARFPLKRSFVLFGNKRRHVINFSCKGVNAIHWDLHTLAMIQDDLVRQFPATKFWHY
ncbi:hypothetical protein KR038_005529, partial [Drosophila bunnanda]